jgi:glycosyltransferase involved in cell wall biosynthesis
MEKIAQQYKVSICAPIYNGSEYLEQLLDSLISQIDNNVEIVLCDDCSIDETYKIAKTYADKYPYIKLYKNDRNIGMDRNFDKTARLANGEYVWFTGQDDIFEKGALNKLLTILENQPNIDFVYFNYKFLNETLTKVASTPSPFLLDSDRLFTDHISYFDEFDQAPHFLPAAVMRREYWESTPTLVFYDTHYVQVGVWLYNFRGKTTYIVASPDYITGRIPENSWKIESGQMLFEIFSGQLEVYHKIFCLKDSVLPKKTYTNKRNNFLINLPAYMVTFSRKGFKKTKLIDDRMKLLFGNNKIVYWFYVLPVVNMGPMSSGLIYKILKRSSLGESFIKFIKKLVVRIDAKVK